MLKVFVRKYFRNAVKRNDFTTALRPAKQACPKHPGDPRRTPARADVVAGAWLLAAVLHGGLAKRAATRRGWVENRVEG